MTAAGDLVPAAPAAPATTDDASPRPVYDLLPAVHRIRDADLGTPLGALLGLVEDEVLRLRDDVSALYDDWFVETCAEWVVGYLADLLGVGGLRPVPGSPVSDRALVANTLRYRRAKGTPAALEHVARDVTGWPARVVEYFVFLATTQHLDHVRPGGGGLADLRDSAALSRIGTALDASARTVDVRHIDSGRGRHLPPHVGVHLWRLTAYRVEGVTARKVPAAGSGCWTFDPAGRDVPLFRPARVPGDGRVAASALPDRLGRRELRADLAARPSDRVLLTPQDPAFRIFLDEATVPVPASDIVCRDLSDWRRPDPGTRPGSPVVAVDPVLGRLAISPDAAPTTRVTVDHAYGRPGDVGAGPFDRRATLAAAWPGDADAVADWVVRVSAHGEPGTGRTVASLEAALRLWDARPPAPDGQIGVIAVTDSATYTEDLEVSVGLGDTLLITAANLPPWTTAPVPVADVRLTATGLRPHLVGRLRVSGSGGDGTVHVDGLQVEGTVQVAAGDLGTLVLSHVTVLAGTAPEADDGWLVVTGNDELSVRLRRTVCTGVRAPRVRVAALAESLFHADAAGPAAIDAPLGAVALDGCTVLGRTDADVLDAGNCLLVGLVQARRRQRGCVRFSYLPPASRTGRRHHCLPGPQGPQPVPLFDSVDPAAPDFGRLATAGPRAIATGSDDEDELGVFHFLHQARRLGNLSSQLDQYLRFGLEAGVFFQT